ncbi:RNA lariat debranching enzyme, putative [Plasmodium ovale]|uniref:RNA lariat debranching enzyme, putative n=2 Tax=Plasmodium ovale TaxID=36330 RepID=A0A1D3TK77_PLAOA|nr:RNA lariat debranching enzyme, putative (DBR1) [Plasmodium ovale curtisi]SBS96215.1 RNA lariat debranching enzyme, putative (DBR1) [Plasmodium ovale curtisi]SCP05364.1 RNA lariat debranching enzyme, putative [Plasmodium ovale]
MIIAVVGCTHGELNLIYSTLEKIEEENGFKVDLLICCGDFECVRYGVDNECLNVPDKYKKEENDFKDYFTGKKKAKVLTIFVGGNHEAMNVLKQLYYGGWVAPNIYFLGYSNVHNINDIRICSLSGIYKKYNFYKKYCECYPYNEISKVSAYHIRKYEIEKLKLIKERIDMVITHDWPNNIEKHGDINDLLRRKFHFQSDVYNNTLGNPHTEILLNKLKPYFWFASHLHVKYSAIYVHADKKNYTRFLALDKAESHKHFIQILNIERKDENMLRLSFDHIPKHISMTTPTGRGHYFNEDYEEVLHNMGNVPRVEVEPLLHKKSVKLKAKQELDDELSARKANRKENHPKMAAENGEPIQSGEKNKKKDPIGVSGDDGNGDDSDINGESGKNNQGYLLNDESGDEINHEELSKFLEKEEEELLEDLSMNEKKRFYLCYDVEWLAILKANHHLISVNSDKDYNMEELKYPTQEDFEFVRKKLNKLEKITLNEKDFFLVHGYNKPNYKNLGEQRHFFLNRFDFEELSIYNEFEFNFFSEEVKRLEALAEGTQCIEDTGNVGSTENAVNVGNINEQSEVCASAEN